jgi:hypothetical protein
MLNSKCISAQNFHSALLSLQSRERIVPGSTQPVPLFCSVLSGRKQRHAITPADSCWEFPVVRSVMRGLIDRAEPPEKALQDVFLLASFVAFRNIL